MPTNTQLSIVTGAAADNVVIGGGEMGALIRGLDWSKTPLGPVFPPHLRLSVRGYPVTSAGIIVVAGPG